MNSISEEWQIEAVLDSRSRRAGASRTDFPRLRLRLYTLLICVDALAMAVAFMVANGLRFADVLNPVGMTTFAVLWPIYMGMGLNAGCYSLAALVSCRDSVKAALRALALSIAITTFLFFSLKIGEDFSRLVFGIGTAASLLFIVACRIAVGWIIGFRHDWTFRREVLLTDGVAAWPTESQELVDAGALGLRPASDDPAMLNRIGQLLDRCERVILACPPGRRKAWSRILAGANVDVEILTPELDRLGALEMRHHGGRAALLVARGPLGLRQRAYKRLLDVSISTTAVLLFLPLLIGIAVAIKIDSPGPVLFRQMRMGRGNRLFHMLKFRTMRGDAADPHGVRSTSRGDERITRIGSFLRRSSLDELPQLFNVLKGDMSIVGPRPHALGSTAENNSFWAIDERYWDRHAIKPGMTGWAQIRGFRGATETREDLTKRLQADLEYLDGWTIERDLAIILRTVGVIVHPNAY